ncbi:hypothetical protein QJ857_gp0870 [Tupanvirus soda lake]|uniref:Ankyrin repeat protein n=2 Tax=Tupanvirus TaxID=2094720 RepID=A0A6N1NME9_9VIRU|nr:hypothetical protein QJ857_gp0870 [Tupanvirus soda lake]QKU35180.1 hypothetical protein [Tupanvirus soda lake]
MFIFNKLKKEQEYMLLPQKDHLGTHKPQNIKSSEIISPESTKSENSQFVDSKNITQVVPNSNEITYEIFIQACGKLSTADLTTYLVNINKKKIREYIEIFLKNNENPSSTILNSFLYLYPKTIFHITGTNNFNSFFPHIKKQIDPNIVNEFNRTFMYYLTIESIINVLESDMVINVNHLDIIGSTFVTAYARYNKVITLLQFKKLVACLTVRNYNFNNVCVNGRSIFNIPMNSSDVVNQCDQLKILIENPEINITKEITWLKLLLKNLHMSYKHYAHYKCILTCIIKRKDSASFLFNVGIQCFSCNSEEDLAILCVLISEISPSKFRDMLNYSDPNGNTIVHIVAGRRFRKVLRIMDGYLVNMIDANKDGKFPSDLYKTKDIHNIFNKIEKH